jgi:hypothetical protein
VTTFPAVAILDKFGDADSLPAIAEKLGTDRTTVHHWRWYDTRISVWAADRYAVRLGFHPSEIWTDWFTHD